MLEYLKLDAKKSFQNGREESLDTPSACTGNSETQITQVLVYCYART